MKTVGLLMVVACLSLSSPSLSGIILIVLRPSSAGSISSRACQGYGMSVIAVMGPIYWSQICVCDR